MMKTAHREERMTQHQEAQAHKRTIGS